MKIVIDASRCKSGGAIAQLKGLFDYYEVSKFNIDLLIVFVDEKVKKLLPVNPGIVYKTPKFFDCGIFFKIYWQRYLLRSFIRNNNIDLLVTADATSLCNFSPAVTISQDLSSFESNVISSEGFSLMTLRNYVIKFLQLNRISKSVGTIFQTNYAKEKVTNHLGKALNYKILPHGLDEEFHLLHVNEKKVEQVVNILYVSPIFAYKHQVEVVKAFNLLPSISNKTFRLHLVGGVGSKKYYRKVIREIAGSDNIFLYDFLPKARVLKSLRESDIFVFASECETFGISLLEAMAAGIPIACSNKSSLPETLRECGEYFDPTCEKSILLAIKNILECDSRFSQFVLPAKTLSKQYNWELISDEFFRYIISRYEDFLISK